MPTSGSGRANLLRLSVGRSGRDWANAGAFQCNAGFRMDFVLLNSVLAPRLEAAGAGVEYRGRERPSDHAPTWIDVIDVTDQNGCSNATAFLPRQPAALDQSDLGAKLIS
jgi:hypothetical protein